MKLLTTISLVITSLLLTACGQKGALYLPTTTTSAPNSENQHSLNETNKQLATDQEIVPESQDF